MMVEFEVYIDKVRVIRDGPWSFDKSLILVKDFDRSQQVKSIKMEDASFWVRVYDLSLIACNEYIGHLINNSLGQFEEIDLIHGEVESSEFMRIRVNIDITKHLLRWKNLNFGLPKPVWLTFKYERLPNICFCCKKIGHNHEECWH